ncbi:hypothetical protein BdWA1_000655 [Babesia duncani]|uniref:Uncharacterized protein n=1 Tax=Babesia duncani TaxID=323732 RepID=A0AAD9UQ95_9APIC|nr:hypothetical protein BdWA1_000655 [Babesia duncani]
MKLQINSFNHIFFIKQNIRTNLFKLSQKPHPFNLKFFRQYSHHEIFTSIKLASNKSEMASVTQILLNRSNYKGVVTLDNSTVVSANDIVLYSEFNSKISFSLTLDTLKKLTKLQTPCKVVWNYVIDSILSDSSHFTPNEIAKILVYILNIKFNDIFIKSKIELASETLIEKLNGSLSLMVGFSVIDIKRAGLRNISDTIRHDAEFDKLDSMDFEIIWKLWYTLSKQRGNERIRGLLFEYLERGKDKVYKFDLPKVIRSMDIILSNSKSLDLLELKFLEKLFKRFLNLYNSDNIPTFGGSSNIYMTTIQAKKALYILGNICKRNPKIFENIVKHECAMLSLVNFLKQVKEITSRSLEVHCRLYNHLKNINVENTNMKHNVRIEAIKRSSNVHAKMFVYCVEFLNNFDLITKANYNNASSYSKATSDNKRSTDLDHTIFDICTNLLRCTAQSSFLIHNVTMYCRSIYQLLVLALYNTCTGINESFVKAALSSISNIQATTLQMDRDNWDISSVIRNLSYIDKGISVLADISYSSIILEPIQNANAEIVSKCSSKYEEVLMGGEILQLDKLVYCTLLNKYNIIDGTMLDVLLQFIKANELTSRELCMFCDLLLKTREMLMDDCDKRNNVLAKLLPLALELLKSIDFDFNKRTLKDLLLILECLGAFGFSCADDLSKRILEHGAKLTISQLMKLYSIVNDDYKRRIRLLLPGILKQRGKINITAILKVLNVLDIDYNLLETLEHNLGDDLYLVDKAYFARKLLQRHL